MSEGVRTAPPTIVGVPHPVLWTAFEDLVVERIQELGAVDVCDIGGGRNPLLSPERVGELGLRYTVLDIAQGELDLAPAEFDTVCADIAGHHFETENAFDFMFSKFVAEHVHSGELLHRNVLQALKPGGVALHYFPTLYCVPFIVNRIVPETLGSRMLDVAFPRDRTREEKFPARYSWTRGPTNRQLERLHSVGFEVLEYTAGFGHDYYRRIPILRDVAERWFRMAERNEWYAFSSFAIVVLRKPK
jgi:SAM-dependent methyltransferase